MLFLHYIIFLKIIISYCYDIINISPYELKNVKFTPQKKYYIFKYNHTIFSNANSSHFTMRSIKTQNYKEYKFYSYTDVKNITQKNGEFIDFDTKGSATSSLIFTNMPSHEYYIVVQYADSFEVEETFYLFSSDSLYEVKNVFYNDYYVLKGANIQNYIFSISSNQIKYVKFGLIKRGNTGQSSLTITDKDYNNTIYKIDKDDFEDIITLEENNTYYFNFSLVYTPYNNLFFLYLLQMNYTNLINVEKNKEEFDYFPVIRGINILLNSSSTPKKHKLYFEYSSEWYKQPFTAYGYTTDDIDFINNNLTNNKNKNQTYFSSFDSFSILNNDSNNDASNKSSGNSSDDSGNKTREIIPLEVGKEDCFIDEVCKGYIIKEDIDFKMVVLKIPAGSKNLQYIKFRYGKEEYIPPAHVIFTCTIGLILALPNIIMYIVRKCQDKMTASKCTLAMNIMLNFAYGNLIGYLLKLGGYDSKMLGESLLLFYIIICLVSIYRQNHGKRTYFDVIYNLSHKLDDSKSLHEVVSYNRKLFPKILVGCFAQHEESREVWKEYEEYQEKVYRPEVFENEWGERYIRDVFDHYETKERYVTTHYSRWGRVDKGGGRFSSCPGRRGNIYKKSTETRTVETWRKESEYKYTSWQDDTQSIYNIKYCSIIEASFSHVFYFDLASQNILSNMKSQLKNEGLTHDTDVRTYDKFSVPNFYYKHICSLNDAEYQRIRNKYSNKNGYLTWIFLFLLGYSSLFETFARYEIGKVNISIVKTVSRNNDKRAPYLNDEINQPAITISFVHTKLQTKALERKMQKGEINNEDMDIPLIVVK